MPIESLLKAKVFPETTRKGIAKRCRYTIRKQQHSGRPRNKMLYNWMPINAKCYFILMYVIWSDVIPNVIYLFLALHAHLSRSPRRYKDPGFIRL